MFSAAFSMWKGSTMKSDSLKKWVNPIHHNSQARPYYSRALTPPCSRGKSGG